MVFQNDILAGAAGAGGDYTIDQSILFNSADSPTMTRSFGTPTDQNKFTYAFWIKSTQQKNGYNMGINVTGGVTFAGMVFNGGNMAFYDYTSGSANIDVRTTFTSSVGKFRDYSAWYHAMFVYDSDQSTDSDRVKFYINGTQFPAANLVGPSGGSVVWPSSGANSKFNASGTTHRISDTVNGIVDGYMADIYFLDGVAATPSDFGEFDEDSNQFVPIAYSGSFGNNGFYLKGQDSSALGDDSSGNGNDFSTSGFTAADQRVDSPTLNKATLNSLDTGSNQTLSEGNLTVTNGSGTGTLWNRSTATQGLTYKTYWEVHADNLGSLNMGLTPTGLNVHDSVNNPAGNVGCGIQNNEIFVTGSYASESSGSITFPIATGNYVMFAYDPDRNALWVGNEGTWKDGTGSSASSATILAEIEGSGTSYAIFTGIGSDPVPYIGQYSTSVATARFSSDDWEGTAPSGYEQLAPSALPDPTIADGSEYYHNQTYTGTGVSGNSITNDASAGDFKPDLLWVAPRSIADNHVLFDSVRGTTSRVYSNKADAQDTDATALITFEADGFDLDTTDRNYNQSGSTYVAWQWHTTGGTSSSNTDGSVTSTVSANTTAGISIATYTGTGSGSSTVGHGLGTTPSAILVKHRNRAQNWRVFHTSEGVGETGFLNDTAAFSADPDRITAVSSTTFTAAANMNESADYVSYCFTAIEGFSKFGSYTGTGSTDGPFVYTGFKPSWIMLKRTNSADNWVIVDAARDTYNAADLRLYADTNNADITSITLDFLSNGFVLRASDGGVNGSGSTYVYLAFAEGPFKTANARGITTNGA